MKYFLFREILIVKNNIKASVNCKKREFSVFLCIYIPDVSWRDPNQFLDDWEMVEDLFQDKSSWIQIDLLQNVYIYCYNYFIHSYSIILVKWTGIGSSSWICSGYILLIFCLTKACRRRCNGFNSCHNCSTTRRSSLFVIASVLSFKP